MSPTTAAANKLSGIASHLTGSSSTFRYDAHSTTFPLRSDLPAIPGAPAGAAWFWGADDELGRLNLLTPARVLAAAKTVTQGIVVPLNLTLGHPAPPCFDRQPFVHTIKPLHESGCAFDDHYSMNPQSGSQWDGFRHFSHQESCTFYNNTKPEDIVGPKANTKCGIQAWAKKGIAGRGILLDFASWAATTSRSYDIFSPASVITYDELVAVGKSQNLDIRPAALGGDIHPGDIVLVRTGFTLHDSPSSADQRQEYRGKSLDEQRYNGIEQSVEMLDWLHDCYVAAIAADSPTLEAWPSPTGWYLHEYLLARWGVPLGELWDLEELARRCREEGRWTFMVTSAPMNVEGGVATPPNALAIF